MSSPPSPWAKIPEVQPVALTEIMSEEMAKELQAQEYAAVRQATTVKQEDEAASQLPCEEPQDENFKTDFEIAKLLQHQFDKEYDDMLKRTEEKVNKGSKVSVSFSNYLRTPRNADFESDHEEEEEPEDATKDWDRFDGVQRDYKAIPPCGYRIEDGNVTTKHDTTIAGRRNACKMMSFPPQFETGDGAGFDLQLSNKVFNSLRMHSRQVEKRRHRMRDKREDHATAEFGMDEQTRLLLYKMINSELLERVNGIISIGKEAVVLHAETVPGSEEPLPPECVIKVFKTTLSEFKQRDKYIKDDFRFKDRAGKQTAKKIVHLWAEKEMNNLNRLRKAGIRAPFVITLKHHILVMSFIGQDHIPAPKLKEAAMSDADYIVAYEQVVDAMKKLYNKANLIHADLSEYNILWYNEECVFIDVSQSVEPSHENAFHFLIRDCTNITHFFGRKGVPNVDTPEQLFKTIVGADFCDEIALQELQEHFKMKPHLVDREDVELDYKFDNAWERTERAKLAKQNDEIPVVEPPVA